jgi:hypothetical protein
VRLGLPQSDAQLDAVLRGKLGISSRVQLTNWLKL